MKSFLLQGFDCISSDFSEFSMKNKDKSEFRTAQVTYIQKAIDCK